MTKKCNRLRGERPKAFWGALVGGAMNLIGSAISSKSQARAIRRQIEAQKEAARTQLELANNSNLASTLNSYAAATRSYNNEDDYNLRYRLGGNKRLGSNRIYITDGGDATKIGNDTYLLRGGSHEQTNETGQTGIGINVGGNEIEAEGGEVAQKKNGALRIFSAQPILGGISPAQAVMSGASKDKVFNAQQIFKKRNHLSDGGDKAKYGTTIPYKRIHINEDGTFTDTLTGKVYNTSATNGEDVVITGKANHWKEAGKKDTSSYFDPMGAVNFISAAGAPILNASPSNVVGSIRDSKNAGDKETAKDYLTTILAVRKGGDRLNTHGGLYTSNSTGIADAFKNPDDGISNGYIGKLLYDFDIDKTKPIVDQLRQARMKIVRGGRNNVFNRLYADNKLYDESINNARRKGAVAVEDNYGRSNGDVLNVTERAYLPGSARQNKLTLQNLEEYLAQENQRGRWNTNGVDKMKGDEELFIPRQYNLFDDYIREARIFMKPRRNYDSNKERKFARELSDRMWSRSKYRNSLIDMSRRLRRRNEPHSTFFDVNKEIPIMDFDEPFRFGGRIKLRNGGLNSKDRGSSKHPYPSVSSKDFAGGGRSYPIPTKADAVDALRLAGLHGRSDVKSKVYSRYPELRKKARIGGSWKAPVYNTNKYRVSNRMRRQIATWEGSDFAGQNRKFKGDAIGAKERELRRMMGRTYNYLNDNQRDSLNSIYYNSRVDTFKNAFGKWFRNLNNAVDRGDERAFNNSLAGIRQSMTVGANRKSMSGLAKRRAWEQDWFGNPIPMDSNETKAILKQQAESRMAQPTDNTRVVIQPEYIEVPAPVGHGVVPVDNPDPNLLQGNIKDNLINMGNKFRLGQRCGGSTRMRKALGGESRPVKGMRSKLAWGDVVYPYRRNNNFDYWTIIDQEQKANDKGGVTPWTTSNRYDVKVPYAITKNTPTIPYTSQVTTPISKVSTNNTIPTYIGNKSGMILRNADWYGLGADLVSSIGGSILGLGAYKNLDFNYNLPNFVEESPVALNTTYHNEAQKSNVERNRLNSRNSILRNTMSGSTAVGRMQGVDTNALYQLNQLADEKTNKETELMNQNLLNEQQVRARNAAAKNQYYNTVASIKNAAIQAKNEAELAKGQILSGTLQGIGNSFQNLINQGRQNYDDTQAMLMGVAASDYATPSRLLELGVDVGDDAALAGIYRSAMNIPNPGARPKREDYSDNTEYSYALTRWENQNKAYQRRNSYADLIKGRMSKKNLIKYGII